MYYKGYNIRLFTVLLGFYFSLTILGVVNAFNLGSALKFIAVLPIIASIFDFRLHIKKKVVPVIIYYIFASISFLWSIDQQETVTTAISFLSLVLLIICVCSKSFNTGEILFLEQSLVWASRLSIIITWIFVSYSAGRLLIQGSIIQEDPNYLCSYFYYGIAYCFVRLLSNQKLINKAVSLFELLLYFFTIFSTGSRGGLLGAFFIILIIIIKKAEKRSFKSIVATIVVLLLVGVSVRYTLNLVDSDVVQRFSQESVEESDGSGRYEIWSDAIKTYKESSSIRQLFGYGMGASRTVARVFGFSRVNVMHNVFLENLIGVGLLGLLLYLLYLFNIFLMSRKNPILLSSFGGMVALSMSTSIIYLKPYWNIIILIICFHYLELRSSKSG